MCNIDSEQAAHIDRMLTDILNKYDKWRVVNYTTESLRKAIQNRTFDCKLLMMDVFEPEAGEDDIATCLERAGMDTDIIYITESQSRVMECYKNRAYSYILKPLHDSDIKREISRYFKERNIHQKCIRITFNNVESYIPIDSIKYVASVHRKVLIYTGDETYEYYAKLDELEKELAGEHFVRCHQSYLVSIAHIDSYENDIIKIGDQNITVSRKYKASFQSALFQAELSAESDTERFVHSGAHKLTDTKGSLICVKGEQIGKIIRLVPENTVVVGRSAETADIVVNLPQVSRQHCKITYHEEKDYYEVQDCSMNGTFLNNNELLRRGDVYAVRPGTNIVFGDDMQIYRLG